MKVLNITSVGWLVSGLRFQISVVSRLASLLPFFAKKERYFFGGMKFDLLTFYDLEITVKNLHSGKSKQYIVYELSFCVIRYS